MFTLNLGLYMHVRVGFQSRKNLLGLITDAVTLTVLLVGFGISTYIVRRSQAPATLVRFLPSSRVYRYQLNLENLRTRIHSVRTDAIN
jgi:hypothetical protein